MSQIIFTNHLKTRAQQRGLNLKDIENTIRFPDKVVNSNTSKKFTKKYSTYQIVATVKSQGNDWIITSAWKKSPSYPKTKSSKKPHKSLIERFIYSGLTKLEKAFSRRS